MNKNKNIGIILAGGVGSRMGLGYPKQFSKIAGKTALEHTLAISKNIKKLMKLSSFLSVLLSSY
ncbi:NTP transferase domain-containing protein [Haemophilus influenzae]|uniref:NTP transferase domain-containing protein n=1 Tax=Haemophilus influenzae TaxID=727 RepID=UPI0023AADFA8|nr:NTP transferase domain-containing protein [Haemophilus influenzae]